MSEKLSFLVASYNRAPALWNSLHALMLQADRDFEVILADGGSTDASPDYCNFCSDRLDITVLQMEKSKVTCRTSPDVPVPCVTHMVNAAFQYSSGDYIVITNEGTIFPQDFVRLTKTILKNRSGAVLSPWVTYLRQPLTLGDVDLLSAASSMTQSFLVRGLEEVLIPEWQWRITHNFVTCIRRDDWVDYDEDFQWHHMDIAWQGKLHKAGKKFYHVPYLRAFHQEHPLHYKDSDRTDEYIENFHISGKLLEERYMQAIYSPPMSKCMALSDYSCSSSLVGMVQKWEQLHRESHIPQHRSHDHRRWEYTMAVRALMHAFGTCGGKSIRYWMDEAGTRPLGEVIGDMPVALPERLKVLDTGGGASILGPMLASTGCDVTQIDNDEYGSFAPIVDAQNKAFNQDQKYIVADTCHLPFLDNSFDAVYTVSVLEHLFDDEAALLELKRVLKPGGLLFATFDYIDTFDKPTSRAHIQERIYTEQDLEERIFPLLGVGADMHHLDRVDMTYQGDLVWDEYSFACLSLVK